MATAGSGASVGGISAGWSVEGDARGAGGSGGPSGLTAATALTALIRPAPMPDTETWSALALSTASISATDKLGCTENMSATTPDTCGAAIDVPLNVR